jgi:dienelactone hydrolase
VPRTRVLLPALALLILGGLAFTARPYVVATTLLLRVSNAAGAPGQFAANRAYAVNKRPRHTVPTRQGDVPAQFYRPERARSRAILLIPGIHSMGIDEPRLSGLAEDLAESGYTVMAMALPDLQNYRITPRATDVIEDAITWMAAQRDLAPDGKIGVAGISFAGGLSTSAAGRASIRDKVAFVLSFGGHSDLPRVMKYLATGEAAQVPGVEVHPPHDYGVAVILHGLADRGVVPAEQVTELREGIRTFLLASQLTLVSQEQALAMFQKARELATTMPEPSRTYMSYVNDRAVNKLGPVLVPFLNQLGADDPALSPARANPPAAPVFLLHGNEDTVIPPTESFVLADALRAKGANVRMLMSRIITHAELDRGGDTMEAWRLIAFWADMLQR